MNENELFLWNERRRERLEKDLRRDSCVPTPTLHHFDRKRKYLEEDCATLQRDSLQIRTVLKNSLILTNELVKNELERMIQSAAEQESILLQEKEEAEESFQLEMFSILEARKDQKSLKSQKKYDKEQRMIERGIPVDLPMKVLTPEKLNGPMDYLCGICKQSHRMRDSVSTQCNHHFGRSCFDACVEKAKAEQRKLHCPLCNTKSPKFFGYRERVRKL